MSGGAYRTAAKSAHPGAMAPWWKRALVRLGLLDPHAGCDAYRFAGHAWYICNRECCLMCACGDRRPLP